MNKEFAFDRLNAGPFKFFIKVSVTIKLQKKRPPLENP